MQRVDLIDLSHWQNGPIHWGALRQAGVRAVYHKATEGTYYRDGNYKRRRRETSDAGIPFGAYHFAKPGKSNGRDQAKFFLTYADIRHGDMRPMLDLEDQGGLNQKDLTQWVGDFVREVKRATGVEPFVYTPFSLDNHFNCPLWVARYSNSNLQPHIPRPWARHTIWQFSDGKYGNPSHVAGFRCDLNTVNMDPAEFIDVFRIGAKPAPHHTVQHQAPKPPPPTRVGLAQKLLVQAHSFAVKRGWKKRAAALAKKINTGPNR